MITRPAKAGLFYFDAQRIFSKKRIMKKINSNISNYNIFLTFIASKNLR